MCRGCIQIRHSGGLSYHLVQPCVDFYDTFREHAPVPETLPGLRVMAVHELAHHALTRLSAPSLRTEYERARERREEARERFSSAPLFVQSKEVEERRSVDYGDVTL